MSWFGGVRGGGIGDLIAARKYGKAIEALKSEYQGKAPGAQTRLQLADLLVQAGRSAEAVPIFLELAEEFATDGFVAKAVAVLKRVEKLYPARYDVQEKLAQLLGRPQRLAPPPGRRAQPVELGIEEFDEAELEESPVAEPPAAQPEPGVIEGPAAEELIAVVSAAVETPVESAPPSPEPEAPAEAVLAAPGAEPVLAQPATEAPATSEGADEAEDAGSLTLFGRLRGALGWLMKPSSPAGVEEPPAAPGPAPVEEPPPVTAEPALVAAAPAEPPRIDSEAPVAAVEPPVVVAEPAAEGPPTPQPEAEHVVAEPEVPETAERGVAGRLRGVLRRLLGRAEETAEAASAAPAEAPPEAPASLEQDFAEEPLTEEAFQGRVLDFVEELLHRAPASARAATPVVGPALLASPIFADLSPEELRQVMQGLRLLGFEPGDIVLTEGEPGDDVFLVASGQVKVFVRNPDGRNFQIGELGEGEFFGEMSSLSGRPRSATVTAAVACELLQVDKPQLDAIARAHAGAREALENLYVERTSSPEAAAIRAISLEDDDARRRALEVLRAHFGESHWDPRMRLRLADVLVKAGKHDDALPILMGLADDLARDGEARKAAAVLRKLDRIRNRNVEELNLAPLARRAEAARGGLLPSAPEPGPARPAERKEKTVGFFRDWLADVVEKARSGGLATGARLVGAGAARSRYAPRLLATPLFEGLPEEALVALLAGLPLSRFAPGDVLLTEGEPASCVYILAAGSAKVFVRDTSGRDVFLCPLAQGSFFGEIGPLTGRPRNATITAATRGELLGLDRAALGALTEAHPDARRVLEDYAYVRAESPQAAALRRAAPRRARGLGAQI